MKVDVVASQTHWLDHLTPVALELNERGFLGEIHVGPEVDRGWGWDHLKLREMNPDDKRSHRPTLVASSMDMRQAAKKGRPIILMEHGAGQSYSTDHASYVGGIGRDNCVAVLVPNEMAAARHRVRYPAKPPVRVIGSPRVDWLVDRYGGRTDLNGELPTVAVSFNWGCTLAPESGSVWPHYGRQVLDELAVMRDAGLINVYGHAHPRTAPEIKPPIIDQVRDACNEREILFMEDFVEVCAASDIYMVDNSSTLFEYAALGRPVVVMNSPLYRRRVNHGLRFWEFADIGVNIRGPQAVASGVAHAIADPTSRRQRRQECVEAIYGPQDGKAAVRAVDAIEEALS